MFIFNGYYFNGEPMPFKQILALNKMMGSILNFNENIIEFTNSFVAVKLNISADEAADEMDKYLQKEDADFIGLTEFAAKVVEESTFFQSLLKAAEKQKKTEKKAIAPKKINKETTELPQTI